MPVYPKEIIDEIRTRTDIVKVVGSRIKLERKGANYFACCPFHSEKTPSFSVSSSRQMYYCFGCQAGGDVISFVQNYDNVSFTEAVTELARQAGVTLPQREMTGAEKKQQARRDRLMTMNGEAALYYYYKLRSAAGREGMDYFVRRGLKPETMKQFGLGYAGKEWDGLYRYLKEKGYGDEEMRDAGLVRFKEDRGGYDYFRDRVMFPIIDSRKRVLGFGARLLGSGEPKYLNTQETAVFDKGRNLYGLNIARSSKRPYLILCEGYMDVIALHQAGFDCATATLGTAFTDKHGPLVKRLNKPVMLCYDSDAAGVKAAMRAIPLLREAGVEARVVNMKPYKDPDEFIVHEGGAAFEERIAQALNGFLFQSDVWRSQFDVSNPAERTAFHRRVAEELTSFTDGIERENYLSAVCARHQIPQEPLRKLVSGLGNRRYETEIEVPEAEDLVRDSLSRAGKGSNGLLVGAQLLLWWAAESGASPERVAELLRPEDMPDALQQELLGHILRLKKEASSVTPAALLSEYPENEEAARQIAAVFSKALDPDRDPAERAHILTGNLKRLRKEALHKALKSNPDAQTARQITQELAGLERIKITEADL
ncbi:MAG: DNA primase [Lachnospiraceae bacterium]|nr:DNA primase [Lachnospiraceae bacterium]